MKGKKESTSASGAHQGIHPVKPPDPASSGRPETKELTEVDHEVSHR